MTQLEAMQALVANTEKERLLYQRLGEIEREEVAAARAQPTMPAVPYVQAGLIKEQPLQLRPTPALPPLPRPVGRTWERSPVRFVQPLPSPADFPRAPNAQAIPDGVGVTMAAEDVRNLTSADAVRSGEYAKNRDALLAIAMGQRHTGRGYSVPGIIAPPPPLSTLVVHETRPERVAPPVDPQLRPDLQRRYGLIAAAQQAPSVPEAPPLLTDSFGGEYGGAPRSERPTHPMLMKWSGQRALTTREIQIPHGHPTKPGGPPSPFLVALEGTRAARKRGLG